MCTRLAGSIVGLLALAPLVTAAPQDELNDLAARVQFNAYVADVRVLRTDLNALRQLKLPDDLAGMQQYFLAYGHWKLADALLVQDRGEAKRAAEQCQSILKPLIEAPIPRANAMPRLLRERWLQRRAESMAMSAGCKWSVAEASMLPGSNALGGMQADNTLEEALSLAPDNPRARFVVAMLLQRRANSKAEHEQAERQLSDVVAAFDALPPSEPGAPDWGHAEALAYLGQAALARGNRIAARNSLERALVLAPDYKWARELLKQTALAK